MRNLVLVRLSGGLGNQMFQYAAGLNLAHRNSAILYVDTTTYDRYRLHGYGLDNFCISAKPLGILPRFFLAGRYRGARHVQKLIAKLFGIAPLNCYAERQFPFNPEYDSLEGSIILDGYWQSEQYFQAIGDIVRKEFQIKREPTLKDVEYLRISMQQESVFIHIRRGDYVTNPEAAKVHGSVPLEYYEAAIQRIESAVKAPVFFVFSDDINWAKTNLRIAHPTHFVDHNNAQTNYQDLRIMASCKHAIIANSSFSWWGGWLIQNPKKIVIAPAKWFANDLDPRDLIPKTWQKA